ncbi:hypothetical protein HX823_17470 [Pseudomonas sp. P7759]|uniref:hypothetical protein n=1 Tax=Pseudomonas sp. P7759 TaxID=2738831 RepID=UPI0015A2C13E|nr:hypothetical protein [Pseudomonas sp. P7759]NWC75865.1 hypothetical protein [Pseudomonas sp. P7759]
MRMVKMLLLWALMPGIADVAAQKPATFSNAAYVERMAAASVAAWPRLATMEHLKKQTGFYAEAQILVYDGTSAWLIDAKGHRSIAVEPVRALGLSSDFKTFQKLSWDERPTVYMGLGQALPEQEVHHMLSRPIAVPELFALATHEAFHFFGQRDWQLPAGSRSDRFPLQVLPRQYRQQLISTLYASLLGDVGALGRASYWFGRWQAEFASEAQEILYYDIVEGTAEYIEGLARHLASAAADTPEVWARSVMTRFPSTAVLSLDGESYALGALAIYLLDRQGVKGWQAIIEGQSPIQSLLASVSEIVDVPDAALNQRIADEVSERNQRLATIIAPLISQLNHPDTVHLLVPMASVAGSVSLGASYQVEQLSGELFVDFGAQFLPSEGRIMFDGATVALMLSKSCGEEGGFMVVPFAAHEFPVEQSGRLQLKRPGVEIDVPFPEKGNGGVWCVRV